MAIIIPDQFVPNTADHKALDTDYVQHTYGGVAETQTSINDNVKKLDAATSYVVCNTAAATAIKEVTIPNYALYSGGSIKVKFNEVNTAANAQLKINTTSAGSSGANVQKALYYTGERATTDNSWKAGEVVEIYYDATAESNAGAFFANNVAGGIVELKDTINTTSPSEEEGVTEKAIVDDIYTPFNDRISTLESTTTSTSFGLQSGQTSIRWAKTSGTETFTFVASSTPRKADKIVLYQGGSVVATYNPPTSNSVTYNASINATVIGRDNCQAQFTIAGVERSITSPNNFYITTPFYYGLFERPIDGTDKDLTAADIVTLTTYKPSTAIISPRGITLTFNIPQASTGNYYYLYFRLPKLRQTLGSAAEDTLNYLTMTSRGYTSTLAMDTVSGSTNQWSQNDSTSIAGTTFTIYRTAPINTTGNITLITR